MEEIKKLIRELEENSENPTVSINILNNYYSKVKELIECKFQEDQNSKTSYLAFDLLISNILCLYPLL